MNSVKKYWIFIFVASLTFISCEDDFLVRAPLDSPSLETFWETEEQAEMWVNNLYNGLGGMEDSKFEAFSDNAYGRAGSGATNIANGSYEPNDGDVNSAWNYRYIRLALEYFENVERVPGISQAKVDELSGQVNFHLAYQYYRLMTLFRDVPLVTNPLSLEESDVPKSSKEEVLNYVLEQVDLAIDQLPANWPESETGRITKGAALALKTRVLLYNESWEEAANTAQQIMDLNEYEIHPNFDEVFRESFNNQTNEVILAYQYADQVNFHPGQGLIRRYAPLLMAGFALILPTPQLEASFQMEDGLPIDESPLYDPSRPFDNRDPRYYDTILYPGDDLNGIELDLSGGELNFARTYIYFKKYIEDARDNVFNTYVNWIIFRYADVLLMYAEAKNEATGPDGTVYEALDQIRKRAGMPPVDRSRYSNQASLREFIRNERRVELAGEGLRYFDIIRWRTAEDVLNINLTSMNLENWVDVPMDDGNPILIERAVETRTFNPDRHYVWPVPQDAIDRSDGILVQHPEW